MESVLKRGTFIACAAIVLVSLVSLAGCVAPGSQQQVRLPSFSPGSGTFTSERSVKITCRTADTTIRYTTDGSDPTATNGTDYTGPVSLAAAATLKARAFLDGYADSDVARADYVFTLVAEPTISPSGGTYPSGQVVTLSTPTNGATIRFTLNGTTPTRLIGNTYGGPFLVSNAMTVKTMAYLTGLEDSGLATAGFGFRDYNWPVAPTSPSISWTAVASSAGGSRLVACSGGSGSVYRSTDSGATWPPIGTVGPANFTAIACSDDGSRIAAATDSALYISTDSGATWQMRLGTYNVLSVAMSSDGQVIFAGASGGQPWISTDSGTSFSLVPTPVSGPWSGVAISMDGMTLAACKPGDLVYTSTDQGVTWTPHGETGFQAWSAIAMSRDATRIAAAIGFGNIWVSDGGNNAFTDSGPAGLNWKSVSISKNGWQIVACPAGDHLYVSRDGGLSWFVQALTPALSWTGIALTANGSKAFAAANGDLLRLGN